MGVDLGTTALKVGIFDMEGNLVVESRREYSLFFVPPACAEEEPDDWWKTFRRITKGIKNEYIKNIKGICTGGQAPTLVSLDKEGESVRPALTWMDRRAICEAKVLSEELDVILDPSDMIPKVAWLRNNEEGSYKKVKWFMQSFDYIAYKLTGCFTCVALSKNRSPWPTNQIDAVDIDKDKFPPIRVAGEILGGVNSKASRETGLPSGIPVIGGLIDGVASYLGAGLVEKGRLCETGGTSTVISLCWDKPLQDPLNRIRSSPSLIKDQWAVYALMSAAGKSLEWFRNNFDPDKSYKEMILKARNVEAGSSKLIVIPHFCGDRCPTWNPNTRGVFFGLSLRHSKPHLIKAILESVGYAIRQNVEIISELGGEIREIRSCGGQAKSDLWSQIKADILGKEILIPKVLAAELVGLALIAGYGIGIFKDLKEAAESFVRIEKVIKPEEEKYERYSKFFGLYKKLCLDLGEDFEILSSEEEKQKCWARN